MTTQCVLAGSEGHHTSDNGRAGFAASGGITSSRDQKALFRHEAGHSPYLLLMVAGGRGRATLATVGGGLTSRELIS